MHLAVSFVPYDCFASLFFVGRVFVVFKGFRLPIRKRRSLNGFFELGLKILERFFWVFARGEIETLGQVNEVGVCGFLTLFVNARRYA